MKTISIDNDNVTILTELHHEISEFVKIFHPVFKKHLIGEMRQRPFCRMEISGIMTIHVAYQITGKQHFRSFYKNIPCPVSYQGFIEVSPMVVMPLLLFLRFRMEMSDRTGLYVIDSEPLQVCMNLRIPRHKVFRDLARRGKGSTGRFYGFRLHMVINHPGELMSARISAGNSGDRRHVHAPVRNLKVRSRKIKVISKKFPFRNSWNRDPDLSLLSEKI